LSLRGFFIPYF